MSDTLNGNFDTIDDIAQKFVRAYEKHAPNFYRVNTQMRQHAQGALDALSRDDLYAVKSKLEFMKQLSGKYEGFQPVSELRELADRIDQVDAHYSNDEQYVAARQGFENMTKEMHHVANAFRYAEESEDLLDLPEDFVSMYNQQPALVEPTQNISAPFEYNAVDYGSLSLRETRQKAQDMLSHLQGQQEAFVQSAREVVHSVRDGEPEQAVAAVKNLNTVGAGFLGSETFSEMSKLFTNTAHVTDGTVNRSVEAADRLRAGADTILKTSRTLAEMDDEIIADMLGDLVDEIEQSYPKLRIG